MAPIYKLLLIFSISLSQIVDANNNSTINRIKSQGYINCGVTSTNIIGFFEFNDGEHKGLDVDFCRALSSAIFGNTNSIKFVPLSSKNRFKALESKKIDVLTRLAAGRRDRDLLLNFETPVFYFIDGTGVMVHEDSTISSLRDIEGKTICKQKNNVTFQYVNSYFSSRSINYKAKEYNTSELTKKAFVNKECDALITDRSLLADIRMNNNKITNAKILDDVIRIEALGPMVAYGDDTWRNIVKWVVLTTIVAEELGISSENIDSKIDQNDDYIKLFFSGITDYKDIGLDKNWVYNIIKQVGNYSEIYERNLGEQSDLLLNRSINNLWINGGLLYAPRL